MDKAPCGVSITVQVQTHRLESSTPYLSYHSTPTPRSDPRSNTSLTCSNHHAAPLRIDILWLNLIIRLINLQLAHIHTPQHPQIDRMMRVNKRFKPLCNLVPSRSLLVSDVLVFLAGHVDAADFAKCLVGHVCGEAVAADVGRVGGVEDDLVVFGVCPDVAVLKKR